MERMWGVCAVHSEKTRLLAIDLPLDPPRKDLKPLTNCFPSPSSWKGDLNNYNAG